MSMVILEMSIVYVVFCFFLPLKNKDNDTLKDILKASVEKPVKMLVYSSKTLELREATVTLPATCGAVRGFWGSASAFAALREPMRTSGMFW